MKNNKQKQIGNNMENFNEINERENYLIELLSVSLDEKQKEVFKKWFHKAVDYFLKDEKDYDNNFDNVVFAILKRLVIRNYDFSDFDFDECEQKLDFFLDKLEGSKFGDIEAEACAMTTSYFMEKRFGK